MGKLLTPFEYNREKAVAYAHRWAFGRNPRFYDFDGIGGDCTNFASQCIYAGSGVMNYTPDFGWYYRNVSDRAPAWTGVLYLFNFITSNTGPGPFGREADMLDALPGDFIQLRMYGDVFHHTPVIVHTDPLADPEHILVAAHTKDADLRPLSTYDYIEARFVHIEGVRRGR